MGIGDWGLGVGGWGFWGLGAGPHPPTTHTKKPPHKK